MKLGISVKLDVTKIDKERLFKGEKGTYLDLTTFIDLENPSQYGDHGFIAQSVSKDEREAGVKGEILGNVKVFFQGESDSNSQSQAAPQSAPANHDFDDDVPFMSYEFKSII